MSSSQNSSSSSDTVQTLPDAYRHFAAVPCTVDVVLGTGEITLRACLALQAGSVIGLEQAAGSDLTMVVNGVVFGRGEVVVMDDAVALRLTELVPLDGEVR